MILTIANSEVDIYYSFVFNLLRRRGKEPILFSANKCAEGETINLVVLNGKAYHYAVIDGKEVNLSKVEAVWYLKPHLPRELRTMNPPEHREFIRKQFLATWQSLYDALRDKKWVSPHWNVIRAENKIYQSIVACNVGFDVPETLISSDPERIKRFWKHCEHEMIIKILATSPFEDHVIFTNKVTAEHMKGIETARFSPAIYQKCVSKKHELRIIVVGDKVFAVRIESQEGETTKIDWRRSNQTGERMSMSEDKLPVRVESRCLNLVTQLGLRFGCIDMIVTPDDKYVFLEINPNGQWWFTQTATGLPIGEAIADLLCGRL